MLKKEDFIGVKSQFDQNILTSNVGKTKFMPGYLRGRDIPARNVIPLSLV